MDADHPRVRALHKAHEHEHESAVTRYTRREVTGGEVDLVTEMAGRLEHLYKVRVLCRLSVTLRR